MVDFGRVSCTVIAACGALIVGFRNYWWNDNIQIMQEQVCKEHLWLTVGCSSAIPLSERGPECTWNSEANGLPVYLVGDSLAGALSEAVLGVKTEPGRPVVVGTQGVFPFAGCGVSFVGRLKVECTDFDANSTAWLMEQPLGDVVLSSSLGRLALDSVALSFPVNTSAENSNNAKLSTCFAGLA